MRMENYSWSSHCIDIYNLIRAVNNPQQKIFLSTSQIIKIILKIIFTSLKFTLPEN